MRRGSIPIECSWCDRPVSAALPLFANGRGWTTCCEDCLDVIAPIAAVPLSPPQVRRPGVPPGTD